MKFDKTRFTGRNTEPSARRRLTFEVDASDNESTVTVKTPERRQPEDVCPPPPKIHRVPFTLPSIVDLDRAVSQSISMGSQAGHYQLPYISGSASLLPLHDEKKEIPPSSPPFVPPPSPPYPPPSPVPHAEEIPRKTPTPPAVSPSSSDRPDPVVIEIPDSSDDRVYEPKDLFADEEENEETTSREPFFDHLNQYEGVSERYLVDEMRYLKGRLEYVQDALEQLRAREYWEKSKRE